MLDELGTDILAKITTLSSRGNNMATHGDYDGALKAFQAALSLLPQPLSEWEASTWLLTAIGDTYFSKGDYVDARVALQDAMHCPNAIGNPFIHLRLGQVQFELGNVAQAMEELVRAWMGEGNVIFDGEDPKYLRLVTEALLPPGMDE